MFKNGNSNAQDLRCRVGGISMKFTPTEFCDLLVAKGVDARNVYIHNWEVKVTIQGDKYTVWPTTGKWRIDKECKICTNIEEFIKMVETLSSKRIVTKYRTISWDEPEQIAISPQVFELRSVMNAIGELLQEAPGGGNYQITVSPTEEYLEGVLNKTMKKVTVRLDYFKVNGGNENE